MRWVTTLSLVTLVLVSCSNDGPTDELSSFLNESLAAYEAVADDQDAGPTSLPEGVDEAEAKHFNLVVNASEDGFCLEGDDESGTWHLISGEDEPEPGDCPEERF